MNKRTKKPTVPRQSRWVVHTTGGETFGGYILASEAGAAYMDALEDLCEEKFMSIGDSMFQSSLVLRLSIEGV